MSKLVKLLADFQSGNPIAAFDRTANTGKYSYSYASYGSVIALLKPLAAKGMCWSHSMNTDAGCDKLTVTTTISYEDESRSASMSFPMPVNIQQAGSVITYMKRYLLTLLTGISSDFDEDGNTPAETGAAVSELKSTAKAVNTPQTSDLSAEQKAVLTKATAAIKKADSEDARIKIAETLFERYQGGVIDDASLSKLYRMVVERAATTKEAGIYKEMVRGHRHFNKIPTEQTATIMTNDAELRLRQLEEMEKQQQ